MSSEKCHVLIELLLNGCTSQVLRGICPVPLLLRVIERKRRSIRQGEKQGFGPRPGLESYLLAV